MKNFLLIGFIFSIILNSFSAEVHWSVRKEGSSIQGTSLSVEDGDFLNLNTNSFIDVSKISFIRFGIGEKELMDFTDDVSLNIEFELTKYDNFGVVIPGTYVHSLSIDYYTTGGAGKSINMDELRLPDLHKFRLTVLSITA